MTDTSATACHYLPDVIVTPPEAVDEASSVLETGPMEAGELNDFLGGVENEDELRLFTEQVAVFRVDSTDEALERLREKEIPGHPVHGLGPSNHIKSMPGTDPIGAPTPDPVPHIAASSQGRIVAVIDTGVTKEIPDWLRTGIHPHSEEEALGSGEIASHGTFVAGLIRRIAPEHTIVQTIARRRPIGAFMNDHEPREDKFRLTSELDVLRAMIRLLFILGRETECGVAALNLSLGGVTCFEDDPTMFTLSRALDLWRNEHPDAPVFAAGGNRDDERPVFPGAFEYVRSVAAAENGGRRVVWKDNHQAGDPPLDEPDRPWITDVAPGCDLLGPSGAAVDDWVTWSGSSFATAIATACYASRRHHVVQGGLVWWPNPNVRYGAIPGLVVPFY